MKKIVATSLKSKELLLDALKELNLVYEVHAVPQQLRGYQNDLRTQTAEIIVRKEELNIKFTGISNDLGFTWNDKSEAYDIIASQYDCSLKVPKRVLQAYAVCGIRSAMGINRCTAEIDESNLTTRSRKTVSMVYSKLI